METAACFLNKVPRQDRNVRLALAQRRHLDRKNAEPVIKILAELPGANRPRGRDYWPQ